MIGIAITLYFNPTITHRISVIIPSLSVQNLPSPYKALYCLLVSHLIIKIYIIELIKQNAFPTQQYLYTR